MTIQRISGSTSTLNSTSSPLGVSGVFTGTFEEVVSFACLNIAIFTDQDSATDGVEFQWSTDGVNVDAVDVTNAYANVGIAFPISVSARYFRIKYTNGTTPQAAFRLGITLREDGTAIVAKAIDKPLLGAQFGQITRSVVTAKKDDGTYIAVKTTDSGLLKVDGSNATQPISAASLPLPSGASTEATLALIKAKTDNLDVAISTRLKPADTLTAITTVGTVSAVTAITNALPTGANTLGSVKLTNGTNVADVLSLTNSKPLTVAIVDSSGNQVGSFGGGTQYTEDAPAAANPVGTAVNLVRQDTPAGLVSTDGDNVAQRGTNYGAGFVQVVTSSGSFVDTFGGGTQYADGAARGTATGTLLMVDDGTNIQSAAGTAAGVMKIDLSATTANATAIKVDGSAVTQPVSGAVTANQGGTWTVQPGNTANTTAWKVDGSAVTQPVSGTITANAGSGTFAVSGPITDAQLRATPVPVSMSSDIQIGAVELKNGTDDTRATITAGNALKVDGSAVTNPISAASLPLPTGAATSANQATEIASLANLDVALSTRLKPADTLAAVTTVSTVTAITNVVHIDDNSGSLTVDNGGTFAVQATIAAGATNIAKAEDVASADADVGVPAMAIQKGTPADTAGTDGDYAMLQMSGGRLWVDASGKTLTVASHAVTNAGTFAVQAAITAASASIASGAIASGAVSSGAFASGSIASGAIASGALASGSISAGAIATGATSIAANEDDASANLDTGVKILAIQKATPADTAGTDGDYAMLQLSAGRLWTSTKIDTALPAGSAVIGHVIIDSGSTTVVTGNVAITASSGSVASGAIASGAFASGSIGSGAIASGAVASGAVASGAFASGSIAAGAVAAGASSFVKLEDVASADADAGVPAMAVRKASPANTSGTDGDYEMLQMSAGRLWTSATIDTALPAGAAIIGALSANQSVNVAQIAGTSTVTGGVAGIIAVGGNVANAVTATANPVPVGGVFTTAPATLTTGQTATMQFTAAQNLKQDITTIAGTAPTTVGKLDVKGADGDVFVRQTTAANLNATIVGTGTLAVQAAITAASGSIASGAIASGAIAAGAIATGATSIAANEDDASANADTGVKILAIQRATPADTAGTDLDYSMLQMSAGRLWTSTAGNKTTNAAAPGATNIGVLPAVANATAPTLTETFQTALSVDLTGAMRVTAGQGAASTVNSSTSTLAANAVFTGTFEEVRNYSGLALSVYADVASAVNGLSIQWSSDGTNIDVNETSNVLAATGRAININVRARYFRVTYTNGITAQTAFRLQTTYISMASGIQNRTLDAVITSESYATITKSAVNGLNTDSGILSNVASRDRIPKGTEEGLLVRVIPDSSTVKVVDLLTLILQELRVLTSITQSGLNVQDTLESYRNDPSLMTDAQ